MNLGMQSFAEESFEIMNLGLLAFYLIYSAQYGITKLQGIGGCVIQILCMLVYLASAVVSADILFIKKVDVERKSRYVINILVNVICIWQCVHLN